jgi:hypothetical protein
MLGTHSWLYWVLVRVIRALHCESRQSTIESRTRPARQRTDGEKPSRPLVSAQRSRHGCFRHRMRALAAFRQFLFRRRNLSLSTMTQSVDTTARLASLRALMTTRDRDVQALVVPSEDQREWRVELQADGHSSSAYRSDSSEYLAHCDQRRAFISGFDGSAGQCTQSSQINPTPII